VVSFREDCSAKTTFAENHDGRPLSYEAGRFIHHALGHDLNNPPRKRASFTDKPAFTLEVCATIGSDDK
jgi:hypothetical protein